MRYILFILSFIFAACNDDRKTVVVDESGVLRFDSSTSKVDYVDDQMKYYSIGFLIDENPNDPTFFVGNLFFTAYRIPTMDSLEKMAARYYKKKGGVAILSISSIDSADYNWLNKSTKD